MNTQELVTLHTEAYRAGSLPMYTITQNPSDYPGKFVVRVQFCGAKPVMGPVVAIEDTLLGARMAIAPLSLHCQPRDPSDDPVIVEVWF
jgi:hypothetical protein